MPLWPREASQRRSSSGAHAAGGDSVNVRDQAAILDVVDRLRLALEQRNRTQIVDLLRRLVALRAPMGNQWQALAHIAAENGELTLARQGIDLFVEAADASPFAKYRKFDLLSRIGALDEADALLRTLPENVPDKASNAYSRGTLALFRGEPDKARPQLLRALELRPGMAQAWLPLATLTDFARAPELAAAIADAEHRMQAAPVLERAAYYYALGKAHADRGEHAQAFAAFSRGAQLKRTQHAYDRKLDRANAAEAVRGYSDERIEAVARKQDKPTGRSIFVTGLPRSGTTLVTQILTAHSAVSDGAEINLLRLLRQDLGGMDYRMVENRVSKDGPGSVARLWDHLLQERFPAPGRVVDKSTDGGYFLGMAAALLPEAPIVWLTRDPLDCAWSCFRTHFFAGLEWSYDLEDIAVHFRLVEHVLSQWREILGKRLLIVPFEGLVTEPKQWTRRLLAHCGLDEEPAVFAPQDNRRPVTTSSVMQVRQPINRLGVGSAEPYRRFLQPFVDAYRG